MPSPSTSAAWLAARREDYPGAAADLDRAFFMDARYQWVFASGHVPSATSPKRGLKELDRALALQSRARPRSMSGADNSGPSGSSSRGP